MPPLYITEQGTKVRIHNNCIRVERENGQDPELLYQAPIGTVSQLVLSGNIGLTTPAIGTLLTRQIDVVFLDSRGNFRGRLRTDSDPQVSTRRGQYRAIENKAFTKAIAQSMVSAKIGHQRLLLQRTNPDYRDAQVEFAIRTIIEEQASLGKKSTVNAIRGVEGTAAAAYFSGYRRFFDDAWAFRRRLKNPSPDPINAMLSFGYTLMTQLAVSAVQTVGLDAYAGFLHTESYNRPSLGLDLVEEFRPIVDEIVLELCRTGKICPEDFQSDAEKGGCWMSPDARKLYIQRFEERMNERFVHPLTGTALTLRQCMLEQARQIADCCEKAPDLPIYTAMEF